MLPYPNPTCHYHSISPSQHLHLAVLICRLAPRISHRSWTVVLAVAQLYVLRYLWIPLLVGTAHAPTALTGQRMTSFIRSHVRIPRSCWSVCTSPVLQVDDHCMLPLLIFPKYWQPRSPFAFDFAKPGVPRMPVIPLGISLEAHIHYLRSASVAVP